MNRASLPTCAAGVPPRRVPGTCCPDCKPDAEPTCTRAQIEACRAKVKARSLPACAAGVKPTFSVTDCCIDCLPPAVANCDAAAIKACLDDQRPCTDGEKPQRDPDACCLTCKRPERLCSVTQVADCTKAQPACVDQRPVYVQSECCLSCRPPTPICTPACADSEVCLYTRTAVEQGTYDTTVCRKRMIVDLLLNGNATQLARLRNLTCDQLGMFALYELCARCGSLFASMTSG